MTYIVLDLEWNRTYARKLKGYFNEIIEIGAVKIDGSLNQVDVFGTAVKPVFSRRLSSIVSGLTGIKMRALKDGIPFLSAISQLRKWISDPDAVVMTWSTTDLLVLLENCSHFLNERRIPFLNYYADLQKYCQQRLDYTGLGQIGLYKACELACIDVVGFDSHRAADDSILAGQVFSKVYERDSFNTQIYPVNGEFYDRLTFKNVIIDDIKDTRINKSDLRFNCERCGRRLRRLGRWEFRGHAFMAEFICKGCGHKFIARVQVKLKYDRTDVSRKLILKSDNRQEDTE